MDELNDKVEDKFSDLREEDTDEGRLHECSIIVDELS
jgi:hypothetical protein